MQQLYWAELYNLRSHANYIGLLLESYECKEQWVKVLLAITSSASIAGWAIWQQFGWIWGFAIAASQVVAAIWPLLPYKNRIKSYSLVLTELEQLFISAEFKWHGVASGEVSEQEINNSRFEIKKQKGKILARHITTTVPKDSKMLQMAEDLAKQYFESYHSIED